MEIISTRLRVHLLGITFAYQICRAIALASAVIPLEAHSQAAKSAKQPIPVPHVTKDIPAACQQAGKLGPRGAELLDNVSAHPSAGAWNALGAGYAQAKQYDCAVSLKASLQLDSQSWETHHNLAFVYAQTDAFGLAASEFRSAIRQKPDSYIVHNGLGLTLERLGRQEDAVEEFKTVIDLKPDFFYGSVNLAEISLQLKRYAAAEYYLQKALALSPPEAVARRMRLGLCLQNIDKFAGAEEEFKRALELDPAYTEAQNNLGVLDVREKRTDVAVDMFQKAILDDPRYIDAYLNLGVVLGDADKLFEASQQFQKVIDLSPDRADAYTGLAEIKVREGHLDQSIPLFRKALELQPDSVSAHINLGVALADTWDVSAALDQFTQAVQLDRSSADGHYHRGRVLAKLDRLDEARHELELTRQLQPNSPSAAYTLARVVRKQRDLDLSTELLRKVIQLSPDYPRAESSLARNLADSGKQNEAIEHWRVALKLDPNDTDALFGLGHALSKSSPAQSAEYMSRLNSLQKDQQMVDRIRTLGNLGIKAADSQDWTNAIATYEEALRLCGECSLSEALHKNLGLIYGHKGEIGKAEVELRQALSLDPNDPDVLQALKALGLKAQ